MMQDGDGLRRPRLVWLAIALAGLGTGSGCQKYERRPLDLASHRSALGERLERLAAAGAVPEADGGGSAVAPNELSLLDGLTSAEGEVVAQFFNPDLRLRRLEAGVALAVRDGAGRWEDPVFGFDGAEVLSPGGSFDFGLTLGFTLPVSGRLGVERDLADAEYGAALRSVEAAEWATRADVRRAWAAWTIGTERLAAARALVDELGTVESLTVRLRDGGELTRAEWRVFASALASREAEVAGLESEVVARRAELLYLLGLPVVTDVELIPGVVVPEVRREGDLYATLIASNPVLAFRRAEYRRAEESLRLEIREQYPDLEVGFGYGSEDGDDRLLLGASVRLPFLNANRAGIAEAIAARELARALAETEYERLSRELAAALSRLEGARAERALVTERGMRLADEQLGELRRLMEIGEVDTFLLHESISGLFGVRERALALALEETLATIRVAELLGPARPAGGRER